MEDLQAPCGGGCAIHGLEFIKDVYEQLESFSDASQVGALDRAAVDWAIHITDGGSRL